MTPVVLVVQDDFGERAGALVADAFVWMVNSPVNGAAARSLWARGHGAGTSRLTTFDRSAGEAHEALVRRAFVMIDDHHGEWTHSQWSEIEVIGCPLSDALREEAALLGGEGVDPTLDGFRLTRRRGP